MESRRYAPYQDVPLGLSPRVRRRASRICGLAILLLLLIGCSDDGDDRQFAGEEQHVTVTTSAVQSTQAVEEPTTPVPAASPLSGSELLLPRGDDPTAILVTDGDVLVFDAADRTIDPLWSDDALSAWAASVSPDGDMVAILASPDDVVTQWNVVLVDTDGTEINRIALLEDDGTPAGRPDVVAVSSGSVAWSPVADVLAVALPTGGMYELSVEGEVDVMLSPAMASNPGGMAWSSNGGAIAFTDAPGRGAGKGLNLASTTALPLDPVPLIQADMSGNRSVESLSWPAGQTIYALVDRRETGSRKGDIMSIEASGGSPTLQWSSGIRDSEDGARFFSVSPDGRVIAIVSGSSSKTSKLVLKEPGGTTTHVFPLPGDVGEASIVWTSSGVTVFGAGTNEDVGAFAATLSPTGELSVVFDVSDTDIVPQATPQASPVASPESSPMASPAATPMASPVAAISDRE